MFFMHKIEHRVSNYNYDYLLGNLISRWEGIKDVGQVVETLWLGRKLSPQTKNSIYIQSAVQIGSSG